MSASRDRVHPVDEVLPAGPMFAVGLQHVLVMYAGAIAVPLIIGGALKLPKDQIAFLINADLFACGIATLVQCIGFPGVGIRLPVMMGVTFACVGPMLSMSAAPDIGISGRSTSWASRYAIVPSVDVMVAPVRFISGQKLDTENFRSIAPRPPKIRGPITAVTSALKWNNGSGVHTTSSAPRSQHNPICRDSTSW